MITPRRGVADRLVAAAMEQMERDDKGLGSLQRAAALANIATALLLQEMLDDTIQLEVEEDNNDPPPGNEPPW